MAESTDRKDAIAYYKKVSKLREMTLACDFAKDKRMMMPGGSFPYLSAGKIRQQFAPLYTKAGLEFEPSYCDLRELPVVGSKGLQHWAITFKVRFIDVDTGYAGNEMTYIGEGSDVLDKGIRKAMTAAYKSWLSDFFGIEEGIDPEISPTDSATFIPKTEEEKVEIKTKIAERAVKPPTPVKPAAATSTPAPKPDTPVKVTAEAPKEPEAPKEEAKPAESTAIPDPGCDAGFKPSGALAKTLRERYQNWQDATQKGLVAEDVFKKMDKAYRSINDMGAAITFNTKYPAQM